MLIINWILWVGLHVTTPSWPFPFSLNPSIKPIMGLTCTELWLRFKISQIPYMIFQHPLGHTSNFWFFKIEWNKTPTSALVLLRNEINYFGIWYGWEQLTRHQTSSDVIFRKHQQNAGQTYTFRWRYKSILIFIKLRSFPNEGENKSRQHCNVFCLF